MRNKHIHQLRSQMNQITLTKQTTITAVCSHRNANCLLNISFTKLDNYIAEEYVDDAIISVVIAKKYQCSNQNKIKIPKG
jgi:hypothetical protein